MSTHYYREETPCERIEGYHRDCAGDHYAEIIWHNASALFTIRLLTGETVVQSMTVQVSEYEAIRRLMTREDNDDQDSALPFERRTTPGEER